MLLSVGLLVISCSDDDNDGNSNNSPIEKTAIVDNYVNIVSTAYKKSVSSAKNFNTTLKTLAANKDEAALTAAKQAWLNAREDYQPTEAFRFYGPIEEVIEGSQDLPYEVSINAWPLDEKTVSDFIADNTTFNEALFLSEFNEDDNITIGWHPIEFILWGADPDKTDGTIAGNKTIAEFTDNQFDYLVAAGDLLIKYLNDVAGEWASDGAFRAKFVADTDQALENVLLSIGTLANAELGGERTLDPWNSPGKDAEHSCFSDNTNRDNALNWEGVVGVYQGNLAGATGASIEDLVKEADSKLAAEITAQIGLVNEILAIINPLEFEDVIQPGSPNRELIFIEGVDTEEKTLVSRLNTFGNLIIRAGNALGLQVTVN